MRGIAAIIVAYSAGVWNGLTDSWWVVLAATLLMAVATGLVLSMQVTSDDREDAA